MNNSLKLILYFLVILLNFRREPGESKLNLKSMRQQLNKIKNENVPKRPRKIGEIHDAFLDPKIFERYGKTLNERRNLYIGTVTKSKKCSFTVFASLETIDMVSANIPPEKRRYLLDGTFKICARPFYQLLIILIEFANDVRNYNIFLLSF